MEILKTSILTFFFVTLISGPDRAMAQDFSQAVKAFETSYIMEASGNYSGALQALKEVYDEKGYEVNLRLGWLSYQSGLFTESIAYYNRAIDIMPYSIEARFGLTYPASAVGNWTQVINQYKKILEVAPNNTTAHHRLGLVYYGRENYVEAKKHFEKVVNLFPFDYDGLIMLGWTNLKMNKSREAKVLFQKALLNTPSGSSASEGLELIK